MRISGVFAAGIVCSVLPFSPAWGFDIVKDGNPAAAVVCDASGRTGPLKQQAADDYIYHVKLITGAALPLVADAKDAPAGRASCSTAMRRPSHQIGTAASATGPAAACIPCWPGARATRSSGWPANSIAPAEFSTCKAPIKSRARSKTWRWSPTARGPSPPLLGR